MPLFVIIGHDVADSSAKRQLNRVDHLKRLQVLDIENRLVVAGPTPTEHGQSAKSDISEMSGSVIIAEFESLEAAQEWANEDPYLKSGVYSHVDIKPFVRVLPKFNDKATAL
ncbi:YciI family protein [Psychrobacter jeotgali]|uniref:YciI family protein n=1 Tax=Psychrobacter jeotgali TaxID=179010 RepID=UPI00191899E0|nr:YciI family protein [Psychrobacter jeotgali]